MKVDYRLINKEYVAEFLIVSVTKIEYDAVLAKLEPISDEGPLEVENNGQTYQIGKIGQYNVVCCKCKSSGTIGANCITMTIVTALQDWPYIKGVFMPGICYGLKKEEDGGLHRSDVIASETVFSYEAQEIGEEIKYKIDPRISKFKANEHMLKAFENSNAVWKRLNTLGEETKATKGSYISGNKQFKVDDAVKAMSDDFPQAIAGDMEGQGLAMACQRYSKPWLLMKGISDFGTRGEDDEKFQEDAATASVQALLNILNDKDRATLRKIAPEGSFNYFYHDIKVKLNDIFFIQYLPAVEEFYINRKIDQKLNLLIRTGCCWVYGDSGVGKSVAITRALQKNKIKYILCDLSRHARSSIAEIFNYIYCSICLSIKQIPVPNLPDFDSIAEEIINVTKNNYAEGGLCILIEEIPFDFGSDKFMHFVESLNSLIISCGNKLGNISLDFVLSTIDTPEPQLANWQAKIKNKMKFIEMAKWSKEECVMLVDMISSVINLQWSDEFPKERLINELEFSPAKIKKFLNDLIKVDANVVTEDIYALICLV